jgi:hypothetical protein
MGWMTVWQHGRCVMMPAAVSEAGWERYLMLHQIQTCIPRGNNKVGGEETTKETFHLRINERFPNILALV